MIGKETFLICFDLIEEKKRRRRKIILKKKPSHLVDKCKAEKNMNI